MIRENYGLVWEIYHCLPIASFNVLEKNDSKKCFKCVNLRPMYSNENNSKKAKIIYHLFLPQQIKAKYFFKKLKKDTKKIFINEINSKPPHKSYETNETMIKSIHDVWSSDLIDMKDYDPKNNRSYRYLLVAIDKFSKIGWTIPLKNKHVQSITDAFSGIIKSSNRKPNLLETDDFKENVNKVFNEFLNSNNIKRYSRYTDKGVVFAERWIEQKGIY